MLVEVSPSSSFSMVPWFGGVYVTQYRLDLIISGSSGGVNTNSDKSKFRLEYVSPGLQARRTRNMPMSKPLSVQVPPFLHGFEAQLSISVSHVLPDQPAAQVQEKSLTKSVHVAPFWHGLPAQSSMSVSQLSPENPALHAHV